MCASQMHIAMPALAKGSAIYEVAREISILKVGFFVLMFAGFRKLDI